MELGVCIAAKIDDIDYAVLAEDLGYTHLWVADSQMLWSDPFATLALVADRTNRVRIGTGVNVAGTRPAAVLASGMATINRLAPGRVFCGIGTGNTAMRVMGHKPMSMAEFERYLRELRPLLRGEETELTWRGRTAPTRHLMPDAGFVAFEPEIPLYVSSFGPKSLQIAGAYGDGAVLSVPPNPGAVAGVRARLAAAADAAGRTIDRRSFPIASLTTMVVLEPGETAGSNRVRAEAGAFAIAALHYSYEQWRQYGRAPGPHLQAFWEDYVASMAGEPDERVHLRIHRGHNCWVEPDEERFVTRELIEATCLVGTAEQLVERLRALDEAGLDQVMILPPLACKEKVLRDVADRVMPHLG